MKRYIANNERNPARRETMRGVENMNATAAASEDAALPRGGAAMLRWTPDQQIVGCRNREKIDPVRAIGRGPHVYALPAALNQISPHWSWRGQAMDVDRHIEAQRVSGVIVLRDRQVLLERYGLGRTENDRWTSYSVGKSVTSILIGAAIQDGYIKSMNAPLTDYIHELKSSAYDGVTVRQLLTMTSGVKWNEDYTDPNSDDALLLSAPFIDGVDPGIAYMRRLPRADQPGAKFDYKTGDSHIAGVLVSKAVGKSMSEYLSVKLWRPFGMETDAFWAVDSAGQELGGGGFIATLRDYARIGQFMLGCGKAGGVQVLPREWLADATRPHITFSPTNKGATGYGYHWWIYREAYAALGHCGQAIFVYPKDKVVIAINSAWPEPNLPEYGQAQAAFVEALHASAVAQPRGPARISW
ncbi:serine hydrolase [Bradyrhizobium sp. DN5]|uniref:serine hydrolase domain-containing protein n=1 Tax=Bradyrhizobium sp. DN5 TaxID=3056950 RepID=UPI003523F54C